MNDDAALPSHLTLKFGYRFGKLSVAVAPADAPKQRKATAAQPTLAAFLANAQANGRRS
jgi:hypothetical protein